MMINTAESMKHGVQQVNEALRQERILPHQIGMKRRREETESEEEIEHDHQDGFYAWRNKREAKKRANQNC